MLPGDGVWMLKKAEGLLARDQRRFFALTFGMHTRHVKISYFSDLNEGVPVGKKGSFPVTGATVFEVKEKNLRVVCALHFKILKLNVFMFILFGFVSPRVSFFLAKLR